MNYLPELFAEAIVPYELFAEAIVPYELFAEAIVPGYCAVVNLVAYPGV